MVNFAYKASIHEKILLLGEGNFSFSKDFVVLNNIKTDCNIEVIATCRESSTEGFSEYKQDTIKFIKNKGVTVVHNVDATRLKSHPLVNVRKYNKVIFNFPHVGGKMKIHLNRRLLQEFFSSVCDVLADGGVVLVALCDGQGGTGADSKKRRWHDSWQITEVAAQSDFILHHVERFDETVFPNYVNVGYRSLEKSFHSANAVVHVFKKRCPPAILNLDPCEWSKGVDLKRDGVFEFLDKNMGNPFTKADSPSSYIFEKIRVQLGDCTVHNSVLDYFYPDSSISVCSPLNSVMACVESVYCKLHSEISACDIFVIKLMNKRYDIVSEGDFSIAPVRCQVMVCTRKEESEFYNYVSLILSHFNPNFASNLNMIKDAGVGKVVLSSKHNEELNQEYITLVESFSVQETTNCHVIHLDDFARAVFCLDDWRYLWNGIVSPSSSSLMFIPFSLYPHPYVFDLGVSVPIPMENQFSDNFFLLLWHLAGDIIIKTELISTYFPPDRDLICHCYRISYKSFNAPLHRKRAIYIHEKIIAVIVSKILNVNIT